MHHVNLVMGKYGVEEIGKGGNQSHPQGISEVPDLGDYSVNGEVRRGPDRRPPTLVEDGGKGGTDLVQAFQVEYDRLINSRSRRW